jgi:WD40-like Beta Propeller Repeat
VSKRTIVLAFAVLGMAACVSVSSAAKSQISPCTAVSQPVWSPDGTEIAYYGTRWPHPKNHHHSTGNNLLQALCTMDGNGNNSQPLRYTVCSEKCDDPPYQIDWLQSGELIYLIDGDLYRLAPGQKPQRFARRVNSPSFAADSAGDRLAAGFGFPGCLSCGGPLTVLDVPSGHVVGKVGGKKLDNLYPSLSPDGSQVVFERDAADDSGRTFGIWTAKANGKGLRHLVRKGFQPLWSPAAGGKIAFRGYVKNVESLRLVSPTGQGLRTLVPRGVSNVFGWSPDGKSIAFERGSGTFGRLAFVDVATGKVRQLLKLYYSPTADWSPDSQELLVSTSPDPKRCSSVWRVPVNGAKPRLLRSC